MADLTSPATPSIGEVAELAVDMWKIFERVRAENAGSRVVVACERGEDRLRRLGFELDTMIGRAYDTNMRAQVVDHEPGDGALTIGRCISPAVFYRGVLIREAEVVTVGGDE